MSHARVRVDYEQEMKYTIHMREPAGINPTEERPSLCFQNWLAKLRNLIGHMSCKARCLVVPIAAVVFIGGINPARAELTFSTVYSFRSDSDGSWPQGTFVQATNGDIYGLAIMAGNYGSGSAFRLTRNGELTPINAFFDDLVGPSPRGLIPSRVADRFYGYTSADGINSRVTVFELSTTNGLLASLHVFPIPAAAAGPASILHASDNNLYVACATGIFQVNPATGAATNLTACGSSGGGYEGRYPNSIVEDQYGNFWGTTLSGGDPFGNGGQGFGTIYLLKRGGSCATFPGFEFVYRFGTNYPLTFETASGPVAFALGADNNFYGVASGGGTNHAGVVFRYTPEGIFAELAALTESFGVNRLHSLNGYLYGATATSIFRISTNGEVKTIFKFPLGSGTINNGLLVVSENEFYVSLGGDGADYGRLVHVFENDGIPLTNCIVGPGPNTFAFSAGTSPGRAYQIQGKFSLSDSNWTNLGPPKIATNPILQISDSITNSQRFYRVIETVATATPELVFRDTFDPNTIATITSYSGGDITNVAVGVVSGVGIEASSALRMVPSFYNGTNGYGYLAGQWQNGHLTNNTSANLSDYVLSFDATIDGSPFTQMRGGFSLTIQESAGENFSTPFPRGTLQTFQAYQGGSDLLVALEEFKPLGHDGWKHFSINLGMGAFTGNRGFNSNFNPTGKTWQITFQMNSSDWAFPFQSGCTLIIDNLMLTRRAAP